MIQARHTAGWIGHSYFRSDPRASADLMAVLRYGLLPNEPGRPLEEIERPYGSCRPNAGRAARNNCERQTDFHIS